ncbi:uncharacterized protein LOC124368217 [Homalodisca vitripennis]|uniref:uncharacterized protein LOC124368217 n=1 Tax=Homalodisca vitripennis TaxID=197043 RepID=UPI001EEC06CA|nr:uncharacterized protein LOC124368217 [Homalodisca vitripennis]
MCCGRKKATQRDEIDRGRGWGLGEGIPLLVDDKPFTTWSSDIGERCIVLEESGSAVLTYVKRMIEDGKPLLADSLPMLTSYSTDCMVTDGKPEMHCHSDSISHTQPVCYKCYARTDIVASPLPLWQCDSDSDSGVFTWSGREPWTLGTAPCRPSPPDTGSSIKSSVPCLTCPCFICLVGIVQTVLYLIDSSELFQLLLYSPDHRLQPWRYVSYMLLHLDTTHLLINLGIQTVLAIPLEAEQGFLRTALVYILGGLAGSLGTAVLDPELSMVGSSAGVYALLLAQLPNILYNYELLRYQWYRVVSVVCLCVGDLTYDMFRQAGPVISWAAHVSGAVAGLLVGLTVFTSYSDCSPLSLSLLRYASIVLFTILVLFSILYIHTHKNKAILHYLCFPVLLFQKRQTIMHKNITLKSLSSWKSDGVL